MYPLALARLAGALSEAGRAVRQFDALVEGLDRPAPGGAGVPADLVGISCRNVDDITSTGTRLLHEEYRNVVQTVRRATNAPIVLGGSGFSIFPAELMRLTGADFGVIGPGERALCALARALAEGGDPAATPGVVTAQQCEKGLRGKGKAEPARSAEELFARPAHDPKILRFYWENAGMIGVQTKRGCPRKCSYCTYPRIDGSNMACADPVALADEVERLLKDFGVRYFFAADSLFNAARDQETAFAEELQKRALPVSWGAFFRPDRTLDREYFALLKASGLKHCEFGTDSLSDSMLSSYQKGFTVDKAVGAAERARELGLLRAHYLVLGGPGETAATIRETMRNAERLPHSVFFPFAGVRIYPHTPLHAQAAAEGVIEPKADCFAPVFYMAPGLSAEAIWEIVGEGTGEGSALGAAFAV